MLARKQKQATDINYIKRKKSGKQGWASLE